MFNPHAKSAAVPLANGRHCLVIDDALLAPEQLVAYASAHRAEFQAVDFAAYPGVYLPAPAAIVTGLEQVFQQQVRRLFDARRLLHMHCRLSMVTTPPHALQPNQWLCHRDDEGLNPQQSVQASVLYLFRDADLGGTSFYEPAGPPQATRELFKDAAVLPAPEFAQRYELQPGYIGASNRYFSCIGRIPGKWNRLIFYDGGMLHSGDVGVPERLSADPARGRLTLNGFFTSRRNTA